MQPVVEVLGDLPLKAGEIVKYEVPLTGPAAQTKEILLYTFISLDDTAETFYRGYYMIYTKGLDGKQYAFYMNVAKARDAVINSDNFWLPFGAGYESFVYASLISAEGAELKHKKKCAKKCGKSGQEAMKAYACEGPDDQETAVGQIMLTGYKK